MGKPPSTDDERSRQEPQQQQLLPNHRRRHSVLPDLNLLLPGPQRPTNRPEEYAFIHDDFSDSRSSSDDEVDEDFGDGDSDEEDDEHMMTQLAEIYISRELAILTNWLSFKATKSAKMEELRREILMIREELIILQKKLGLNP